MDELTKLIEIIQTLRGPNGCQWDKEQTLDTIKPYLLEETYEVIESILEENFDGLKEELGDLLCQIVFISQLSTEKKQFSIVDVISGINEKLVRRHPHVFGHLKTKDTDEILRNWEKIKAQESKNKNRQSVLDGIPKTLPGLTKAYKTQEKASRLGFDWKDVEGALEKLKEEWDELRISLSSNNQEEIENELGDIFFSLVNVCRFLSVDPEFALQKTINKFSCRFHYIEKQLKEEGISFENAGLEKMNYFWEKAKALK